MKTEEEIRARLAELREKLRYAHLETAPSQPANIRHGAEPKIYRLEGNIGALEWVLREGI
jgi:hypothetical protein